MQYFDHAAACGIVSDLELASINLALAQHWLSLWSGNAFPNRSALRPADLKRFLPNLILFDVVPDESVVVRLAGTQINFALGTELTGRDWIDLAPPTHRAERLRIFSRIVSGAIGRGVRNVEMKTGNALSFEEILLPLRGDGDSGTLPVLCHVDWNPGQDLARIASREQAWGPALAFETIPLPLLRAA
jgi:hypothetical protein